MFLIVANLEINSHARVYTQWLNIMEQLVQWEDVPFMSGIILDDGFILVWSLVSHMNICFSYRFPCLAVTSQGNMTLTY